MFLLKALESMGMSQYKLAKLSGVPYSTINAICNQKAQLDKCSVGTLRKIAEVLTVPVETLLMEDTPQRCSFSNFKSNVCHRLKALGDADFMIGLLESGEIRKYFNLRWYAESFYLLAMLDYLCRVNDLPLCNDFNDLRGLKLQDPLFSSSVVAMIAMGGNAAELKAEALRNAIPEFVRFNIIEGDVHNVA